MRNKTGNSRGRPKGYKLSEESKSKIAKSKTGQKHSWLVKRKIGRGVKKFYKTPKGKAQIERMRNFQIDIWNSEEGLFFRNFIKEYYEINYKPVDLG